MQLAAQLHPDTYSWEEAQEVLRLVNDLVEWEYKRNGLAPTLKVVTGGSGERGR